MRFGIVGVAGYVAPRHLSAISAIHGDLVVALDIADRPRHLDSRFLNVEYFTSIERMERHLLKEAVEGRGLDYLSICSPSHLHDGHIQFALRNGAHAICEKPVAINPWNLDALRDAQRQHGRQVWTILQLRLLPSLAAIRESVASAESGTRFEVDLTYITERGRSYFESWKGIEDRSGGIATNIGIHFFDFLQWVFGSVQELRVHVRDRQVLAGTLVLDRADVRWFLSVDAAHLPDHVRARGAKMFRSIVIDGMELDFTSYATEDLHTASYRQIIAGAGFGLDDAAPSIQMTHDVRASSLTVPDVTAHPLVRGVTA